MGRSFTITYRLLLRPSQLDHHQPISRHISRKRSRARDQDPVYLTDDMQLRFKRSYGPEMYTVSGFDFRVEVLDVQSNQCRSDGVDLLGGAVR